MITIPSYSDNPLPDLRVILQTLARVEEFSALVLSAFKCQTADKSSDQHVTVSPKIFLTRAALLTASNNRKIPAAYTGYCINNGYVISSLPH